PSKLAFSILEILKYLAESPSGAAPPVRRSPLIDWSEGGVAEVASSSCTQMRDSPEEADEREPRSADNQEHETEPLRPRPVQRHARHKRAADLQALVAALIVFGACTPTKLGKGETVRPRKCGFRGFGPLSAACCHSRTSER